MVATCSPDDPYVCTRHERHQAISPGGQEPTGGHATSRSVQSISLLGPQPRRTLLNKIKQCRRIARRHDKLAASYLAFVQLASIGCGSASLRPSVGGEADAACVCLREGFLTSS